MIILFMDLIDREEDKVRYEEIVKKNIQRMYRVAYRVVKDEMLAEDAVRDGRILTGRAAGAAFPFGLALLEVLKGREVADKVAAEVVYDRR